MGKELRHKNLLNSIFVAWLSMGATTLSMTTFSIMTLSMKGLFVMLSIKVSLAMLSINYTGHKLNSALQHSAIMLSVIMLNVLR